MSKFLTQTASSRQNDLNYWLNYWHTLISKDRSGFTSNTIYFGNVKAIV